MEVELLGKTINRPVDVYEAYNRAKTGQKMDEKIWDFKIIPQETARLKKKYDLVFNRKEIVPTDNSICDRLFQAGLEMLVTNGMYCIDTKRVIKVTEAEVIESLKKAPTKLIIGEGKEAAEMIPRTPADSRRPLNQGGPTGAPVSEEIFVPMFQSYAQEATVDCIVSGVMNTIEGNSPTPGTPWEIKATRWEVSLVREACRRAGRPGMGL